MEKIKVELSQYPSSFRIKEYIPKKKDIKIIKEKLLWEIEAENEYDTDMEKHRTWNLISFLCFVLGDLPEAEIFNKKVLDSDTKNIIALSNKAWFSVEANNMKLCKETMERLKSLSKNTQASLIATAEMAHSCSRFGISYTTAYDQAKKLYKYVIEECDKILETNSCLEISVEYFCVWMFGYALIQNRQLNIFSVMDEKQLITSQEHYKDLVMLYCRIIDQEGSSICLERYRARSYVNLGLLASNIQYHSEIFPLGISQILPRDQMRETGGFFEKALEIFGTDAYVLERSGKYFRYSRDLDRSIKLLEEAVKIKRSSFGCHHLALSLKRKLDIQVGNLIDSTLISSQRPQGLNKACGHETSDYIKGQTDNVRHTEREGGIIWRPRNAESLTKDQKKKQQSSSTIFDRESECITFVKSQSSIKMKSKSKPLHDILKTPKSPKHINYEKNKDSVDKILGYFEMAYTVSYNPPAMYDTGLLYRQIGDSEEALKIFETLAKNKDGHTSRLLVANAYEQAAFCIFDSLDKSSLFETAIHEEKEYKMKIYLKSSLEISCNIVAKIPYQVNVGNRHQH